jgi:hypothetical protein
MSVTAVFARILRPGVTLDEFVAAWAPESTADYPADVEVGVDPSDDRRVITAIRFDGTLEEFQAAVPRMVHPESLQRLEKVVDRTELEGVYETSNPLAGSR